MTACHECGAATDESCERCRRPTCADSYYEREHLGLCKCCHKELTSHPFDLTDWPYKLRKPFGQ